MKIPRLVVDGPFVLSGVFAEIYAEDEQAAVNIRNDRTRGDSAAQRDAEEYFLERIQNDGSFVRFTFLPAEPGNRGKSVKRLGPRRSARNDVELLTMMPDESRETNPDAGFDWDETDVGVDGEVFSYYPTVDLYISRSRAPGSGFWYNVLRVDVVENS